MATLSQTKSRRMYSWWWDSHISPKNSKWLQDNLTDVDCKVKSMIKLIEEDADSFARRAEMYYKKRPELMKLVEELYRAYRALAERYDHATVVIRQAHRTMSEAFPNQDPSSHFDDLSSESGDDPRMPENEDEDKAVLEDSDFTSMGQELKQSDSEKNAALDQYVLALEKISNLENRLEVAEEDAKKMSEQAEKAEMQIVTLKQEISKLNKEKEASVIQYRDLISSLETKLSCAQEELHLLRVEVENGVTKLKGAEELQLALERSKQSLKADMESITSKIGAQGQELTEKQLEIGRLWSSLQEERSRFVEAETAFQTLQHLHAQTQEELRSLATELQSKVIILNDVQVRNQNLQNEVSKVKEENMSLSELNASSAIAMKKMKEEVEQRNVLQQEIYGLKEELNELNTKHTSILDQINALGMSPEGLQKSVKQLQDEILNLKGMCDEARIEKESLLVKLEVLGHLLEKNSILENSLSNLSAELDASRGKIQDLEESCQSLFQEKANILIQLQTVNENLEKLAERNNFLENSLSDANDELQAVKEKLKNIQDSYHVIADQKSHLSSEKDILSRQLETTRVIFVELEKKIAELEAKYLVLEEEKTSADCTIQELQVSLEDEKLEHAIFAQVYETQVDDLCSTIRLLQAECQARESEFEIEQDRGLHSANEIFILKRCVEDLRDSNLSLLVRSDEALEASAVSKNLISQLQKDTAEKHNEVKSLSYQIKILRKGLFQVLNSFDLNAGDADQESIEQYQFYLVSILHKIEDMKRWLEKTEMENQLLVLENMIILTLFRQLQVEAAHLEAVKMSTEKELNNRTEQNLALQNETSSLQEMLHKTEVELEMLKEDKEKVTHAMDEVQQKAEIQELDLQSDKEKLMDEMRIWETQAMSIFGQLQTVTVSQFVYEQKVHELGETCRILEHASNAKDTQVKLLPGKPKSEISEADDPLLTKDIMLDQVSENSSNGVGKREVFKVNNEFVELWRTADPDDNKLKKIVTPTPEKIELRRVPSMRRKKRVPSSDSVTEKEMVVEKLESSTKSMDIHQAYNRKVLKRLNSDVQKLANLHITVQDLKRKLEITDKGKKGKTIDESNTLKEQLDEAEAMVLKLLDQNGKLLKNIEDGFLSSDSKSTMDFDSSASFRRKNSLSFDGKSITGFEDSDNIRRKRVSDQARRMSEKIGRLQLEVQKIQYLLLKFDEEQGSRGMSESKRRVLLRDYLYGVSRPSQSRRKKVTFCACIRPSTRD